MKQYFVKNISNQIYNSKYTSNNEVLYVNVPGSKSITNRALLLATLSSDEVELSGVLFSDDSRHFLQCVRDLGINADIDEKNRLVKIKGCNNRIPLDKASIYVGSAGTAARFLAATLGVSNGTYHLDASEQMRKRPMAPLLSSLSELGCKIQYSGTPEGHFPFTLIASGFAKNEISINIDSSSQFLSALLIASVLSDNGLTVNVTGSHGMAYIEMTRLMMEQFGVKCTTEDNRVFKIAKDQKYSIDKYAIEPDASAAAYFYALSPLLGITVCVPGIHSNSLQGDVAFIDTLVQMGCSKEESETGIILYPPKDGIIHGITIDMSSFSDQAITLAAIAPFADSPTTITGIGHIRLQESDRLSAIATELSKMHIKVEEASDSITIYPGTPSCSEVDTYDDHRMAMGFSLIGLRSDNIVINDPDCCRKTFENYFEVLDEVINSITQTS